MVVVLGLVATGTGTFTGKSTGGALQLIRA